MANNVIEFKGLDDLVRGLKDRANLDDVKRVIRVNGAELQREAKRLAPYRFGNLKRSINLRILDKGFTAKISTNVHYAGYQEFGTRYILPKRFMWRAYVHQKRMYENDMKRLVK